MKAKNGAIEFDARINRYALPGRLQFFKSPFVPGASIDTRYPEDKAFTTGRRFEAHTLNPYLDAGKVCINNDWKF